MTFTAVEQTIIDALVRHSALREEITLSALASECHVAKSTVIKTVQKLGFRGFKDFVYTYKLSSSVRPDRLLPERIVDGNIDESADILANHFFRFSTTKNFIHLGGRELVAPIAQYVSRKLAMFDIFAPATYDYALMEQNRLPHGFALLFPRTPPHDLSRATYN